MFGDHKLCTYFHGTSTYRGKVKKFATIQFWFQSKGQTFEYSQTYMFTTLDNKSSLLTEHFFHCLLSLMSTVGLPVLTCTQQIASYLFYTNFPVHSLRTVLVLKNNKETANVRIRFLPKPFRTNYKSSSKRFLG